MNIKKLQTIGQLLVNKSMGFDLVPFFMFFLTYFELHQIKKALKINDLSAFSSEWFPIW